MKFSRPYILLAITGALLLLLSFLPNDRTIDIPLHDTVLIIAVSYFFGSLGFLLLYFWLIYNLVYKIILSKTLAWVHIIGTLAFIILLIIISFAEFLGLAKGHYYPSSFYINHIILAFSIIAILAQLLFLINIFAGLIKKVIEP